MTSEEARNLLRKSQPKDNNAFSLQLNEALNMAIKVLQTDCISREMARRIIDSGRTREQMLESLETAPDIVQELKNKGEIE